MFIKNKFQGKGDDVRTKKDILVSRNKFILRENISHLLSDADVVLGLVALWRLCSYICIF